MKSYCLSIDLKKLEEWKVIQSDGLASQEWLGSDSESDDDDEEDDDDDDDDSGSEDSEESPMDTD